MCIYLSSCVAYGMNEIVNVFVLDKLRNACVQIASSVDPLRALVSPSFTSATTSITTHSSGFVLQCCQNVVVCKWSIYWKV